MSTPPPQVWEVSPEFPSGRARPMTDAELAQYQTDQAAGTAQATAAQQTAQTAAAIADNLNARMVKIRQARTALASGNVFAAMTANEKAIIDGLLEDDLYLARLALHLYDAVT